MSQLSLEQLTQLGPYAIIESLIHAAAAYHLLQSGRLIDLKNGHSIELQPENNVDRGTLEFLAATGQGEINGNSFSLSPDSYLWHDNVPLDARVVISWLDQFSRLYQESQGSFPVLMEKLRDFQLDPRQVFQTQDVVTQLLGVPQAIALALLNYGANDSNPDLVNVPLEQAAKFLAEYHGDIGYILAPLEESGHISNGALTELGEKLAPRGGQAHLTLSYAPQFKGLSTAIPGKRNYDVLQPANAKAAYALIASRGVPNIIKIVENHARANGNKVTIVDFGSGEGSGIEQPYVQLKGQYDVTVVGFDRDPNVHTEASKRFNPYDIGKSVHFVVGDMLVKEDVRKLLETHRPDVIMANYLFHDIGASKIEEFLTNIREASMDLGLDPLLVISESYRPTVDQRRTNPNLRYFVALHDWSGQSVMPRDELHEFLRKGSYQIIKGGITPIVEREGTIYNEILVLKIAPSGR